MMQEPKKKGKEIKAPTLNAKHARMQKTNEQRNADQTALHRAAETLTKLETNMTN
jgi:uncharacterized membrane protein